MRHNTRRNVGYGILILITLAMLSMFIVFASDDEPALAVAVTSNTFVNPDWARLECSPTDAYEFSLKRTIDRQQLFVCDGFTEDCRFRVTDIGDNICVYGFNPYGRYRFCDIEGNNCGAWISYSICQGLSSGWGGLDQGESVEFDTGFHIIAEDDTEVTFEYRPWKLYRFVGGAKFIVNSANCEVTSSLNAGIRQVDYPGSTLFRIGGEGQKWVNYVNAWNYGPGTNVFSYQGNEVYCNAAKLYEIVELQMADGQLRKLNPEYQDSTESGDVIKGQGSFIKNVECCPNEPNCNDNFEFDDVPNECFTDAQCLNAGGPIPVDGTHYIFEKCVGNLCVLQDPVTVECTNTAICVNKYGSGYVCDLSTTNYGKCILQQPGGYCGDNICEPLLGETENSCCADCGSCVEPPVEECASCWNWLKDKLDIEQECETGFIDRILNTFACPLYFIFLIILFFVSLFGLLIGQQFLAKQFIKLPKVVTWLIGLSFGAGVFTIGYILLSNTVATIVYMVIVSVIVVVIGIISAYIRPFIPRRRR